MSQRPTHPPARDSMSPPDRQHHEASDGRLPHNRPESGSFRRTAVPSSDGRVSGELEGSTLGSSSRDGDRRTPNPRRTQSSGGFLLDPLPRSNSTRISSHRPRPSVPSTNKRITPEPEIVVPKKRSRFPWSRHKNTGSESTAVPLTSSPQNTHLSSTSSIGDQQSQNSSAGPSAQHTQQSSEGLDRDSLQIVSLALNLNESRRRNASGLPAGSNGRRPLSVSQPLATPVDLRGSAQAANQMSQDHSYRNFTQYSDEGSRLAQSEGNSQVVNLLPAAVANDFRAHEFSDGTIARAEKARRHFELFHEYLRLLPLLPPLRSRSQADDSDTSSESELEVPTSRGYNPLQMVRNRRIRYREKCPINTETEGWIDPEKVHDWIDAIEDEYHDRKFDETNSIKLPSFTQGHRQISQGEAGDDVEMLAGSPPSSLRRVSRTNSVKAPRLRLDWKVTPAELIADAAWVEDVTNKAKILDKDGNKIYPDPAELVLVDTNAEIAAAAQREQIAADAAHSADDAASSRHNSLSSSHPARAHEFKSVARGRHRHRFQSHVHDSRSRSISSSRKRSRWDKMRIRSGSASSDSSVDDRRISDLKQRTLEHSRRDLEKLLHRSLADSSDPKIPRSKTYTAGISNVDRNQFRSPQPLLINTKVGPGTRKASLSSTGSFDDRRPSRTSLDVLDTSTAPNSPAQVGSYFPSIAANLSPTSSRSPSPAKKGLRHKIVAHHERSKSKHGDRVSHKHDADGALAEGVIPKTLSPPLEQAEFTGKLEPSPLPDVVSPYAEDLYMSEAARADSFRGRKGQNLPESKFRGIFKGPSRIAERVGNEVSKVGDLILKKDQPPDSRKSSSATTLASESESEEDEKGPEKRSGPKGLLRRLPNIADDPGRPGRLVRRDSDKGTPRTFMQTLPSFTSPLRKDERNDSSEAVDFGSPSERASTRDGPPRMGVSRSRTFDSGPPLPSHREHHTKPHKIKDLSVPYSMTRPPVTGLAQASAGSPTDKRPPLSGGTRAWSISNRSLQTLKDSGVPSKAEVERARALLLSSGIKAREITRRAHSVRDPAPHWLQSSFGSSAPIPGVTRIGEYDLGAQNFLRRFEVTQYSFQQSMHHFSTSTSSPLRGQLKDLEILINETLTPRVRATADEAENMCVQLNTTSTLAVKSLSDALDRGIRKRRRRLRWVRRFGFVVLEWALVAMLWWVWLIVMGFKLVRGVFRGTISGVRWILWL